MTTSSSGRGAIEGLRAALRPAVAQLGMVLPDFLPVGKAQPADGREDGAGLALPALLSKVLLALALDFERESRLALRAALAPLDGDLLRSGTAPYPDGWRAKVARPATLPHYPVISPRGGFPDGS